MGRLTRSRVLSPSKGQLEYYIQCHIAAYLRDVYPDIVFRSDLGGIKLTMGQAVKVKRVQGDRAFPDMFICAARNDRHGLFGEIKVDADEVYTKKGELRQDKHIREQFEMLLRLRQAGYEADFWLGLDDAKAKIDRYLAGRRE